MNRKIGILTTLLSMMSILALGQNGTIRGTVYDKEVGETLIGAAVVVEGTSKGAATDLDGAFSISVPAGTYSLKASFISYQEVIIKDVVVKPGQVTVLDFYLPSASEQLTEVVIEAKIARNTENAVMLMQKNASSVMDGISSQQIRKMGDSDAAGAIRRVTGVSVQDGKYVSVRGLGDRYSKTLLNGVEIPSLDPERNAVQMDMFPTNLIDNMLVYKTFTPDKPGDFTGGLINLVTKDFPEKFTLQFSTTLGFNDQSTFNQNFLTYQGSSTDWLGVDNGSRDVPAGALDLPQTSYDFVNSPEAQATARRFQHNPIITSQPRMDQTYAFSIGNQTKLFGKELGFLAAITYRYTSGGYENGVVGRYENPSPGLLRINYDLTRNNFSETNLWGAMLNGNLKLNSRNKIGLTFLRNQSGESQTQMLQGQFYQELPSGQPYFTQSTSWTERFITSGQLKGEHVLNWRDTKINWISSLTSSGQRQPDLNFFAYDFDDTKGGYQINSAAYQDPARFDRTMDEINSDNRMDIEIPYVGFADKTAKLMFGGRFLYKNRDFTEFQFDFIDQNGSFNGSVQDFFDYDNIVASQNDTGYYVISNRQLSNTYNGLQTVSAAYLMTDLPITEKLKFIFGVRFERTDIQVESQNPNDRKGNLVQNDFLPSFNAMYEVVKDMNIRASYNRSLARPTFREMAPFASYLFAGDYVLVGNPSLDRTVIDNLDLRWEWYPALGDFLSFSLFYKEFTNPIERKITPEAANLEVSFVNTPSATVYGFEAEARKRLNMISTEKNEFLVGANYSYIVSQTSIDRSEYQARLERDPNAKDTRPMFGQSPYIINAYFTYNNNPFDLTTTVSFNQFGERLSFVSRGGVPDVYEQPRPTLDLTVEKGLGEHFTVSLRARNLLNPDYAFTHDFQGQQYDFERFTVGRTFRISVKYLF